MEKENNGEHFRSKSSTRGHAWLGPTRRPSAAGPAWGSPQQKVTCRPLKFKPCTQNCAFGSNDAGTTLPGRETPAEEEKLPAGSTERRENCSEHCLAVVRRRRGPSTSCLAGLQVLSGFSEFSQSSLRVLSEFSQTTKAALELSRVLSELSQTTETLLGHPRDHSGRGWHDGVVRTREPSASHHKAAPRVLSWDPRVLSTLSGFSRVLSPRCRMESSGCR